MHPVRLGNNISGPKGWWPLTDTERRLIINCVEMLVAITAVIFKTMLSVPLKVNNTKAVEYVTVYAKIRHMQFQDRAADGEFAFLA